MNTADAPPGSRPGRTFASSLLMGLAALVIVLAGLRSVSDLVGPVFLALVLTITLHPGRVWLETKDLPGWAASIIMLLAAYVVLILLTLALVLSISQLAVLIPQYTEEMRNALANVMSLLSDAGVEEKQIQAIMSSLDPGQLFDLVMSVLSSSLGVLANVFFLFTMLLFFAFDTDGTRRGLTTLRRRFPAPVDALNSFAVGTRNYMSVSAVFGLIVAVIDGAVLYLLDIPGAFVWAVLAFVTNFIPNIGFVIGVVPPAFIALLDHGTGMMFTVIAVYCIINFVIQSIIQPRVVGDSVGLSASLTFLSLVFWTWVIGPIGALLAVPLSLLTRAVLVESDPARAWALSLISGKSEADPSKIPS